MKKVVLLSISILWFIYQASSQVQLSQYFLDGTLYNPAFAGSQEAFCVNMFGRQQWMGLTDTNGNNVSPQSAVLSIHAPIFSINSGLGMNVIYDKAGFQTNLGVKINYNYRFTLKDEKKSFAVGLAGSILSKSIDFSQMTPEVPGDPLLTSTQNESGIIPDLGFGIQYQQLKKFYFGISGINLMESSANIGNIKFFQKRYLYATTGYYLNLAAKGNKSLYLIPSVLVKSDLNNMQIDINSRIEYNNVYWAGVSWRYQDAAAIMAGVNLKGLRIGASYDLTIGNLSKVSGGSVEFFVGYCYTIQPKVKLNSLYNTRYL
jgi:type IX secretion system PorP/SprF family membrane protein